VNAATANPMMATPTRAPAVDYISHLRAIQTGEGSDAAYRAAANYFRRELLPLLPNDKSARIVDIGSGYGHLVRFLSEHGYARVGAVDSSRGLLDAVRANMGGRLEFSHLGDGVAFLESQPTRFDLITLWDVAEHIEPARHVATVRALYGALRSGGRVIVRTPNMANLFGTYSRYIDLTHQCGFTEWSLYQWLRQGGFENPRLWMARPGGRWKDVLRQLLLNWVQRKLLKWQDRTVPQCLDKNIVVWAQKAA
jgi:2-polyprenyl-3-methyl-5-hydroxy-6-metoxy-1,4-benzoquinol methylase